jgi:undecaprenyl-diphosphatase
MLRRLPFSLRTTAALGCGMLLAIAFLALAWPFARGEPTELDRSVSLWVHGFDSAAADQVMRFLTYIGSPKRLVFVVVVAVVWLWVRGSRALAVLVLGVYLASLGANTGLKNLFQRARPDLFFEIAHPKSYSFPSGHALLSTAVFGSIAGAIGQLRPAVRPLLYPATAMFVFSIGLSRIYLGVHWATDVTAGFIAGGILLCAFAVAARPVREGGALTLEKTKSRRKQSPP